MDSSQLDSLQWLTGDIAMSMSMFGNSPFSDSTVQSLDVGAGAMKDEVESYFYLPPSLDSPSDAEGNLYSPYGTPGNFELRLNHDADDAWRTGIAPSKLSTYGDADLRIETTLPLSPWQTFESSSASPTSPRMSLASTSPESERMPRTPEAAPVSPRTSAAATRKLRGAVRKNARGKAERRQHSQSSDDSAPSKLQYARQSHNLVEKQYRNRLNNQFELLLATVSETRARAGDNDVDMMDEMMGPDKDRALSKSAVLQLARQTLIGLEAKNRQLSRQVEELTNFSRRMSGVTGPSSLMAVGQL